MLSGNVFADSMKPLKNYMDETYYKSSDFAAQVLKEGMKWSDEEVTKSVAGSIWRL